MEELQERHYTEKIIDILKNDASDAQASEAKESILEYHPYEIAEAFVLLDSDLKTRFLNLLSPAELAPVFEHLDSDTVVTELMSIRPKLGAMILENMARDDAADVLQSIEDIGLRTKYLNLIKKEVSQELKEIMAYDTEVVGSMMIPSFIAVSPEATIGEASKILVHDAPSSEYIDYLFVIEHDLLIGTLSLKELLYSEKEDLVRNVMNTKLVYVNVNDQKEDAIKIARDYDLTSLPVVDDDGEMVGIVTFDDIIDALDEAVSEDFALFGGISNGELTQEDEKLTTTIKKRLPWLLMLLVIGIFTSGIVSGFENVISAIPLLVMFLPVISDMSGDVGTQSLATAIHMLSTRQLNDRKDVDIHLLRELGAGFLNALTVGVIMFLVLFLFYGMKMYGVSLAAVRLSGVISGSLLLALLISNLAGAVIPLVLAKLKVDPAAASGPLITTVNDVLSVVIYFSLATIFLLR